MVPQGEFPEEFKMVYDNRSNFQAKWNRRWGQEETLYIHVCGGSSAKYGSFFILEYNWFEFFIEVNNCCPIPKKFRPSLPQQVTIFLCSDIHRPVQIRGNWCANCRRVLSTSEKRSSKNPQYLTTNNYAVQTPVTTYIMLYWGGKKTLTNKAEFLIKDYKFSHGFNFLGNRSPRNTICTEFSMIIKNTLLCSER